jgi:hypothetical protein
MKAVNVYAILIAFYRPGYDGPRPKLRPIDIGVDVEQNHFDAAFQFGQNDFQPVEGCYSVSVGDVIVIDFEDGTTERRAVEPVGFSEPLDRVEIRKLRLAREAFLKE